MKYLVANWKMYAGVNASIDLAAAYRELSVPVGITAIVAPTTLAAAGVQQKLANSAWKLAAQNVSSANEGAYTGEISAAMLREIGAEYVLVGHSERRHLFGESNTEVAKKMSAAWQNGVTPILCVGETAEDLAANKRQYRLKKQLQVLVDAPVNAPLIVAYEPVWAISGSGNGAPCLPVDVQDVHGFIKTELATLGLVEVPLLYGGSVKADTVTSYVTLADVDGVLVGSASLRMADTETFLKVLGSL